MSEENKQVLNEKTLKKVTVSPAQLRYATTLFYLGLASFIIMLVTYFLYVSGVTTPLVPLEEMPKLWVREPTSPRGGAGSSSSTRAIWRTSLASLSSPVLP